MKESTDPEPILLWLVPEGVLGARRGAAFEAQFRPLLRQADSKPSAANVW